MVCMGDLAPEFILLPPHKPQWLNNASLFSREHKEDLPSSAHLPWSIVFPEVPWSEEQKWNILTVTF